MVSKAREAIREMLAAYSKLEEADSESGMDQNSIWLGARGILLSAMLHISEMERQTVLTKRILIAEHIRDGEEVRDGYPGSYQTAPLERGFYSLYEVVDDNNQHVGWEWELEDAV